MQEEKLCGGGGSIRKQYGDNEQYKWMKKSICFWKAFDI